MQLYCTAVHGKSGYAGILDVTGETSCMSGGKYCLTN